MSEHRIIRHSGKPSRSRSTVLLLAAIVCSATVTCELVIGDLPVRPPADSGPPPPDGSPTDAVREVSSSDVAPETGSVPDGDVEAAADSGDADSPDQGIDAAPCTIAVPWYADDDGDGYGRLDARVVECPKPEGRWARAGGDCNDNDPRVHPFQTAYFGASFPTGQTVSFDYDCSGAEEGDPGQARFVDCGLLSLALCESGSGYAQGSRTGPGLDPFCGSTTVVTCQYKLAILLCEQVAQTVVEQPFRCR